MVVIMVAPGYRQPSWPGLDGQMLAICIIAFFLSTFTSTMFLSHTQLILINQSTLEAMALADMQRRETVALQKEYGILAFGKKRAARKEWDEEWGKLKVEIPLYAVDGAKQNWKSVMGTNPLLWLFPPFRYRLDDGLHYSVNPRRGPEGQWRRRSEWPKELQ